MWLRRPDEDRLDWQVKHINRLRWAVLLACVGFGMVGIIGRVIAIFHANVLDRLLPLRTSWNAFLFLMSMAFGIWFWNRTRGIADQSHDSAEVEGNR
jgi:hypothetical protein